MGFELLVVGVIIANLTKLLCDVGYIIHTFLCHTFFKYYLEFTFFNKESLNVTKAILLPSIVDVIVKIKQMEELKADEELVYLMYIEKIPEAVARKMINDESYENADD